MNDSTQLVSVPSRSTRSFRNWVLLFCFICMIVGLFLLARRNRSSVLPDGSLLSLRGVSYGTNVFIQGNLFQRILGRHIPAGGISILGQRVYPPMPYLQTSSGEVPPITAWFRVQGSAQVVGWHFVAGNRDGRRIYCPPANVRASASNDFLVNVPISAFPRDSKEILLYVVTPIRALVQPAPLVFKLLNPLPISVPEWEPGLLPATNRTDDFDLVLDNVTVATVPFQGAPLSWRANVRFRMPDQDAAETGPSREANQAWKILDCRISDCEGNTKKWNNRNAQEFRFVEGLEAGKTWKVQAIAVRNRDFPAKEMFHLSIRSSQTTRITNSLGAIFSCFFSGQELTVNKLGGWDENPYLEVRSPVSQSGLPVKFHNPMMWQSGTANRFQSVNWLLDQPVSSIELDLIEPKIVKVDFFVRPAVEQ